MPSLCSLLSTLYSAPTFASRIDQNAFMREVCIWPYKRAGRVIMTIYNYSQTTKSLSWYFN